MSRRARAQQAAQAARERQRRMQQRQRRQRTAWVSAVAVAVLVAVGVLGAAVWQSNRPGDVTVPTAATVDGSGLPVGDGPVTVEIYLDFLCPSCAAFDTAARSTLDAYLSDGTVTVVYRPIAILDDRTSTRFSTRAAAAAGCAADAGTVDEYVATMMAAQPVGVAAGLSDDEIVALTGQPDAAGFAECVGDGAYLDWVRRNTDEAFDRGVQGTPTVFVAGNRLEQLDLTTLTGAIDAAAGQG